MIPINFMLLKSLIFALVTGLFSLGSVLYKNFNKTATTTIKIWLLAKISKINLI